MAALKSRTRRSSQASPPSDSSEELACSGSKRRCAPFHKLSRRGTAVRTSYSPAASSAPLTTLHASTHRASTLNVASCSSASCSVMSSDGCAWGLRMP